MAKQSNTGCCQVVQGKKHKNNKQKICILEKSQRNPSVIEIQKILKIIDSCLNKNV